MEIKFPKAPDVSINPPPRALFVASLPIQNPLPAL
jgi:hypothetical protein